MYFVWCFPINRNICERSIQITLISMSHFCVNIYPPISLSAKIVHLAPLRPRPGGNQGDDRHKLISEISWTPICKMFPNIHTHGVHKLSPAPRSPLLSLVPPPPVPCVRPGAELGLGLAARPFRDLDNGLLADWMSAASTTLSVSERTRAREVVTPEHPQISHQPSQPAEFAILCLMFKYLC